MAKTHYKSGKLVYLVLDCSLELLKIRRPNCTKLSSLLAKVCKPMKISTSSSSVLKALTRLSIRLQLEHPFSASATLLSSCFFDLLQAKGGSRKVFVITYDLVLAQRSPSCASVQLKTTYKEVRFPSFLPLLRK